MQDGNKEQQRQNQHPTGLEKRSRAELSIYHHGPTLRTTFTTNSSHRGPIHSGRVPLFPEQPPLILLNKIQSH